MVQNTDTTDQEKEEGTQNTKVRLTGRRLKLNLLESSQEEDKAK